MFSFRCVQIPNTTTSYIVFLLQSEAKLPFFITVIVGDLGEIPSLLFSFLLLAFSPCGRSGISFSCIMGNHFVLSMTVFLLIFLGLLKELLRLKALFGLVSFILSLRGCCLLDTFIIT